ncbi:dihydrofolate reductase [Hanstruepera marina]|uniref:dihydrofolate reductase n=1 Tax=Hanstruepera marina TaxID=2873265 RepID=UPI001CA705A0|nr:dihydrofolate reductase [Hanstruepera marina]
MFGRKKNKPQVNQAELELLKNAQRRLKQKKGVYTHFILFIIGSVCFIVANLVLGIGETVTIFNTHWFVSAIALWFILFLYHAFKVFVTDSFMGKQWQDEQLNTLIAKQKAKIAELQKQVENDYPLPSIKSTGNTSKKSNITLIVAAGEDNAIGKDNDLIWHLSDDLKRFKNLTNGHHIIMGRKTFESFPKPLPNRTHIVITRQDNYQAPSGVIVVNNLEDAFDAARSDSNPYVIGGGEIYKQAMPYADKIELTRVHQSFENADTFFPEIDESVWKETQKTFHDKDEKHQYAFSFITYLRS